MEALTSSYSKALFDGLGSSSSRIVPALHFSDRLEFSLSTDKVGNFGFLQTTQNKGISPVRAVPYEPQVDLETEEPQAQQNEETKVVRIKLQLQKDCLFGEQFLVVGDDPMIGAWDPSNALPMTWSEGHLWFVEMDVPMGRTIQYKFILKSMSGDIMWQPGSDRIVKTWETVNRITVCEDWENAELQKITEEEQPDYSDGQPLIDSEMSNFSENLDHPEEETVSDATNALDFEDSKSRLEEKPLAQPDVQQIAGDITSSSMEKPMAIVAENIDSSEDAPKSTPRRRGVNNMALQSEVTVHDLEHMGKVSQVNNQGKEVLKGNLFDFEGSPVLVPGLTPPKTEETTSHKVEERDNKDTSVEALEKKDQDMPEVQFNEGQEESDDGVQVNEEEQEESDDGKPQEIAETLSDEPVLVDNEGQEESDDGVQVNEEEQEESDDGKPQEIAETLSDEPVLVDNGLPEKFHSTTAIAKVPEVHTAHENVLESDIQWGRGILKNLLSKLGFP
ncbi:uncharacterized protein LOC114722525 [Neltuma alba]|uniref:uncharacterized protein LOC114722525 n=1 Tax=Neltuma alba TaxID=207710 RepID=UPI0010A3D455|nr:uncharacterized protein LOC114722525 [Prosopis alba]